MEQLFMFSLEQDHVWQTDRSLRRPFNMLKKTRSVVSCRIFSGSVTISHPCSDLRTTLYLRQLISNKVSSAPRHRVRDYWKKGRRTGMTELEWAAASPGSIYLPPHAVVSVCTVFTERLATFSRPGLSGMSSEPLLNKRNQRPVQLVFTPGLDYVRRRSNPYRRRRAPVPSASRNFRANPKIIPCYQAPRLTLLQKYLPLIQLIMRCQIFPPSALAAKQTARICWEGSACGICTVMDQNIHRMQDSWAPEKQGQKATARGTAGGGGCPERGGGELMPGVSPVKWGRTGSGGGGGREGGDPERSLLLFFFVNPLLKNVSLN